MFRVSDTNIHNQTIQIETIDNLKIRIPKNEYKEVPYSDARFNHIVQDHPTVQNAVLINHEYKWHNGIYKKDEEDIIVSNVCEELQIRQQINWSDYQNKDLVVVNNVRDEVYLRDSDDPNSSILIPVNNTPSEWFHIDSQSAYAKFLFRNGNVAENMKVNIGYRPTNYTFWGQHVNETQTGFSSSGANQPSATKFRNHRIIDLTYIHLMYNARYIQGYTTSKQHPGKIIIFPWQPKYIHRELDFRLDYPLRTYFFDLTSNIKNIKNGNDAYWWTMLKASWYKLDISRGQGFTIWNHWGSREFVFRFFPSGTNRRGTTTINGHTIDLSTFDWGNPKEDVGIMHDVWGRNNYLGGINSTSAFILESRIHWEDNGMVPDENYICGYDREPVIPPPDNTNYTVWDNLGNIDKTKAHYYINITWLNLNRLYTLNTQQKFSRVNHYKFSTDYHHSSFDNFDTSPLVLETWEFGNNKNFHLGLQPLVSNSKNTDKEINRRKAAAALIEDKMVAGGYAHAVFIHTNRSKYIHFIEKRFNVNDTSVLHPNVNCAIYTKPDILQAPLPNFVSISNFTIIYKPNYIGTNSRGKYVVSFNQPFVRVLNYILYHHVSKTTIDDSFEVYTVPIEQTKSKNSIQLRPWGSGSRRYPLRSIDLSSIELVEPYPLDYGEILNKYDTSDVNFPTRGTSADIPIDFDTYMEEYFQRQAGQIITTMYGVWFIQPVGTAGEGEIVGPIYIDGLNNHNAHNLNWLNGGTVLTWNAPPMNHFTDPDGVVLYEIKMNPYNKIITTNRRIDIYESGTVTIKTKTLGIWNPDSVSINTPTPDISNLNTLEFLYDYTLEKYYFSFGQTYNVVLDLEMKFSSDDWFKLKEIFPEYSEYNSQTSNRFYLHTLDDTEYTRKFFSGEYRVSASQYDVQIGVSSSYQTGFTDEYRSIPTQYFKKPRSVSGSLTRDKIVINFNVPYQPYYDTEIPGPIDLIIIHEESSNYYRYSINITEAESLISQKTVEIEIDISTNALQLLGTYYIGTLWSLNEYDMFSNTSSVSMGIQISLFDFFNLSGPEGPTGLHIVYPSIGYPNDNVFFIWDVDIEDIESTTVIYKLYVFNIFTESFFTPTQELTIVSNPTHIHNIDGYYYYFHEIPLFSFQEYETIDYVESFLIFISITKDNGLESDIWNQVDYILIYNSIDRIQHVQTVTQTADTNEYTFIFKLSNINGRYIYINTIILIDNYLYEESSITETILISENNISRIRYQFVLENDYFDETFIYSYDNYISVSDNSMYIYFDMDGEIDDYFLCFLIDLTDIILPPIHQVILHLSFKDAFYNLNTGQSDTGIKVQFSVQPTLIPKIYEEYDDTKIIPPQIEKTLLNNIDFDITDHGHFFTKEIVTKNIKSSYSFDLDQSSKKFIEPILKINSKSAIDIRIDNTSDMNTIAQNILFSNGKGYEKSLYSMIFEEHIKNKLRSPTIYPSIYYGTNIKFEIFEFVLPYGISLQNGITFTFSLHYYSSDRAVMLKEELDGCDIVKHFTNEELTIKAYRNFIFEFNNESLIVPDLRYSVILKKMDLHLDLDTTITVENIQIVKLENIPTLNNINITDAYIINTIYKQSVLIKFTPILTYVIGLDTQYFVSLNDEDIFIEDTGIVQNLGVNNGITEYIYEYTVFDVHVEKDNYRDTTYYKNHLLGLSQLGYPNTDQYNNPSSEIYSHQYIYAGFSDVNIFIKNNLFMSSSYNLNNESFIDRLKGPSKPIDFDLELINDQYHIKCKLDYIESNDPNHPISITSYMEFILFKDGQYIMTVYFNSKDNTPFHNLTDQTLQFEIPILDSNNNPVVFNDNELIGSWHLIIKNMYLRNSNQSDSLLIQYPKIPKVLNIVHEIYNNIILSYKITFDDIIDIDSTFVSAHLILMDTERQYIRVQRFTIQDDIPEYGLSFKMVNKYNLQIDVSFSVRDIPLNGFPFITVQRNLTSSRDNFFFHAVIFSHVIMQQINTDNLNLSKFNWTSFPYEGTPSLLIENPDNPINEIIYYIYNVYFNVDDTKTIYGDEETYKLELNYQHGEYFYHADNLFVPADCIPYYPRLLMDKRRLQRVFDNSTQQYLDRTFSINYNILNSPNYTSIDFKHWIHAVVEDFDFVEDEDKTFKHYYFNIAPSISVDENIKRITYEVINDVLVIQEFASSKQTFFDFEFRTTLESWTIVYRQKVPWLSAQEYRDINLSERNGTYLKETNNIHHGLISSQLNKTLARNGLYKYIVGFDEENRPRLKIKDGKVALSRFEWPRYELYTNNDFRYRYQEVAGDFNTTWKFSDCFLPIIFFQNIELITSGTKTQRNIDAPLIDFDDTHPSNDITKSIRMVGPDVNPYGNIDYRKWIQISGFNEVPCTRGGDIPYVYALSMNACSNQSVIWQYTEKSTNIINFRNKQLDVCNINLCVVKHQRVGVNTFPTNKFPWYSFTQVAQIAETLAGNIAIVLVDDARFQPSDESYKIGHDRLIEGYRENSFEYCGVFYIIDMDIVIDDYNDCIHRTDSLTRAWVRPTEFILANSLESYNAINNSELLSFNSKWYNSIGCLDSPFIPELLWSTDKKIGINYTFTDQYGNYDPNDYYTFPSSHITTREFYDKNELSNRWFFLNNIKNVKKGRFVKKDIEYEYYHYIFNYTYWKKYMSAILALHYNANISDFDIHANNRIRELTKTTGKPYQTITKRAFELSSFQWIGNNYITRSWDVSAIYPGIFPMRYNSSSTYDQLLYPYLFFRYSCANDFDPIKDEFTKSLFENIYIDLANYSLTITDNSLGWENASGNNTTLQTSFVGITEFKKYVGTFSSVIMQDIHNIYDTDTDIYENKFLTTDWHYINQYRYYSGPDYYNSGDIDSTKYNEALKRGSTSTDAIRAFSDLMQNPYIIPDYIGLFPSINLLSDSLVERIFIGGTRDNSYSNIVWQDIAYDNVADVNRNIHSTPYYSYSSRNNICVHMERKIYNGFHIDMYFDNDIWTSDRSNIRTWSMLVKNNNFNPLIYTEASSPYSFYDPNSGNLNTDNLNNGPSFFPYIYWFRNSFLQVFKEQFPEQFLSMNHIFSVPIQTYWFDKFGSSLIPYDVDYELRYKNISRLLNPYMNWFIINSNADLSKLDYEYRTWINMNYLVNNIYTSAENELYRELWENKWEPYYVLKHAPHVISQFSWFEEQFRDESNKPKNFFREFLRHVLPTNKKVSKSCYPKWHERRYRKPTNHILFYDGEEYHDNCIHPEYRIIRDYYNWDFYGNIPLIHASTYKSPDYSKWSSKLYGGRNDEGACVSVWWMNSFELPFDEFIANNNDPVTLYLGMYPGNPRPNVSYQTIAPFKEYYNDDSDVYKPLPPGPYPSSQEALNIMNIDSTNSKVSMWRNGSFSNPYVRHEFLLRLKSKHLHAEPVEYAQQYMHIEKDDFIVQ